MARRITMDSGDVVAAGCGIASVVLVAGAAVGWVMNIAKIVAGINDPITALLVLRCVAVFFFPLGCVLGWF